MNLRTPLAQLFVAAAILVGPAAARALDHSGNLTNTLLAPRVTPSVAVADKGDDARRQREIYRILCGGAPRLEGSVSDHLWHVAESLARESWEPPKVTIRVVVSEPGRS
jgi:hypothetical protein